LSRSTGSGEEAPFCLDIPSFLLVPDAERGHDAAVARCALREIRSSYLCPSYFLEDGLRIG
jgi:hypothetical protein